MRVLVQIHLGPHKSSVLPKTFLWLFHVKASVIKMPDRQLDRQAGTYIGRQADRQTDTVILKAKECSDL